MELDLNDENNRRMRDEQDENEDIKATVKLAQSFIDSNIMTEKEALKYFNIPKAIFDRFSQ
ncbi:hypothetical protein F0919_18235 [Taibaiella lutea]|uniref:Uncharacterized protein n=1 Tax=Taibaiella lutea TaxID=2608001 RepID=A0A5M6CI03_9BACT|nr:hypothetical protein [Taibaiella lutea]KAA5532719.1 hypothetical protein F0919_18235 [Taibaiella lutea]